MSRLLPKQIRGCWARASVAVTLLGLAAGFAHAQGWSWTFEKVDSGAKFTSLAVDSRGNVHVSYTDSTSHAVKYAFRSVETSRWYNLEIEKNLGNSTTRLALDSHGNPHICYLNWTTLKYAYWDGKRWINQEISPGGAKEYTCSLAISSDGTPYVSWYEVRAANGKNYYHIRNATLKGGAWLAQTIDFDGEAGKWNSTIVDNQGKPYVSYSVFPTGELKVAQFNGKEWQVSFIDSLGRGASKVVRGGMGNCLRVGPQGTLYVSYFGSKELRYAVQNGDRWVIQKVDDISPLDSWAAYLSSLGFDHSGKPHISYDDGGALKHVFWDGERWHVAVLALSGSEPYRYSSLGIGPDDTIYISFSDPQDGSLKVAIGRPKTLPSSTATVSH